MADELKPCPFCGGEASIRIHDYYDGVRLFMPKCKCGAGIVAVFRTEEEAVAAWNTRAERTCHMKQDGMFLVCSECGVVLMGNPRYCSRCGARVLSEEEQGHLVADAIRRLEKAVER